MRTALSVFFAVHAVSASLAVGLPFVICWYQDRRRPETARALVTPALVNMSVAVVTGVAALLFVCRARPKEFAEAVAANFVPLLATVPLLAAAFASMYAYQIRGWQPGPLSCGGLLAIVAAVFAEIGAHPAADPVSTFRLAHFIGAGFAAAGVALMVRFAGEDAARSGARLALMAAVFQGATGGIRLLYAPAPPAGLLFWLPVAGAAGFAALLALLAFGARITRFAAWASAAGLFFVVLAMSALRDAIRG